MAKLEKASNALVGYTAACLLKWQAVTDYGDPPNNGYLFDDDSNPANGQFLTSALDLTESGQAPDAWFVTTTNSGFAASGVALARRFATAKESGKAPPAGWEVGARRPMSSFGGK